MDFLPHQARLSAGIACLPHEYDTASTIFQWLVFAPFFALIPTVYSLYVAVDVMRRKLLPPQGKKRNLAIYFFRLVVVFLVMWIPSIFLLFVAGGHLPAWVSVCNISFCVYREHRCPAAEATLSVPEPHPTLHSSVTSFFFYTRSRF
jgi:hypothetical protein